MNAVVDAVLLQVFLSLPLEFLYIQLFSSVFVHNQSHSLPAATLGVRFRMVAVGT